MPDPIVVSVFLQQILTELEESRMGQAVVFENNDFRHLTKDPVKTARHPLLTTEINL